MIDLRKTLIWQGLILFAATLITWLLTDFRPQAVWTTNFKSVWINPGPIWVICFVFFETLWALILGLVWIGRKRRKTDDAG